MQVSDFSSTHFVAAAFVAAISISVAGCQSNGGAVQPDAGVAGQAGKAPAEKVTASDLRAYCPKVELREGTAYFSTYKNGAEKTPKNVIYQASITAVTRTCRFNADKSATMTVAVEGKIVPGPLGSTGTITMPIRVALVRGDQVVNSTLNKYKVTVSDTSGATQFIYDDENIAVPAPVDRSLQVFVGYDEGPYGTP